MFRDLAGGCNDNARAAIRLGFHDAGTWDRTQTHGGADGSFPYQSGMDAPGEQGTGRYREKTHRTEKDV